MKAIPASVTLPAIHRFCSAVVIVCAVALRASAAGAQTPLAKAAEGRSAAGGAVVIAIHAGTKVSVVTMKGTSALVTIEGYVDASRLTSKLDTFPASVDAKASLRVRASASDKAAILGELRPRTGVRTLGKSGTWMKIRRGAWIPMSALPASIVASGKAPVGKPVRAKPAPAKAVAQAPTKPAPSVAAEPVPAATALAPGAMSVSKPTKFLSSPEGSALGELAPGTVVQTIAKDHGFTKVRVEGWVSERELVPADSSLGSQLTAADLRADPEGTHGKMVQWEVQVLSLQTADPLRPDLARDEPYLLAKGPGDESALLYLAVPPSLLNQAKALQPLTKVLITARVRVGHSEPVGTPILDLKSISKR